MAEAANENLIVFALCSSGNISSRIYKSKITAYI